MIRNKLARVALLALAVPVVSLATSLPASAASSATITPFSSGGGCSTNSADGNKAEGCISASGSLVKGDAYVITAGDCVSTTLTLWDLTANTSHTVNGNCALGHHGVISITGVKGHKYATYFYINYRETATWLNSWSPTLTFSN
ncbi:hypothetical protein ACEZCY_10555 [Streptacidiphilus sp. N1-12]|uniref:Secreted protein n=2 Tax=Streptacidiphilus alkalitolerans TaxID=3342712 RepID=A0ABV6V6F2_9ACTN